MGIRDFISSGTEMVKRNTPDLATPVTKVCKSSYCYSEAAVRKIDDVVRVNDLQKLGQSIYMPDEEGRAKIVNFSTKFVKNASSYFVKEAANIFIPGGRAVSQIYSQTVREVEIESKKNQNMSRDKEITGNSSGSKIVKEGPKDQSPSRPRLDKQDFTVMMEEMQAKMEKLQDDMNNMKQQNEVSAKCTNGLDSFEFSDEPIKSSTPTKSNPKKVLIRSRM